MVYIYIYIYVCVCVCVCVIATEIGVNGARVLMPALSEMKMLQSLDFRGKIINVRDKSIKRFNVIYGLMR